MGSDLSGITMNVQAQAVRLPFAFVAIEEKRGCIRNSTYVVGRCDLSRNANQSTVYGAIP